MKITKKIEAEIKQIMDNYWDSYLKGDLETWSSYLPDNYKNIGTTKEELWNSKKDIVHYTKKVLNQMIGMAEIRDKQTQIIPYDPYIMVHEFGDMYIKMEDGWSFYAKLRLSSLLKKVEKGWNILHQHGSYPDSKTEEGETIAFEKISKENLELRDAIKRRTFELQNKTRELEIEAALERVRSIAMGMQKSDDLLNICEVSYNEFEKLGFDNLRAVLIHILDDDKRTFADYDYCGSFGGQISTLSYDSHPVVVNYFNQIRSSKDAFAEAVFSGKELERWKKVRLETGQKDDPRLYTAEALYYYGYSIGIGDFSISTLKPIDEAQINILKRFRNVFDLAYRRFIDIEKAEAQAREGQIQLALEKVRLVALGLKKSEEMLQVAKALYEQLIELGFRNIRNAIIDLENGDGDTFTDYDYSHDMSGTITQMSYHDDPTLEGQFKKMAATTDEFFELRLEDKELQDLINMRLKNGEAPDPRLLNAELVTYNLFSFGNGAIGISNFGVLNEDEKVILDRFRYVFTFAYKRYNDLALAEAQAREAQIELSLERVRAHTMAMQKSDELKEVIQVVYQQFVQLNINIEHTGFIMDYRERDDMYIWLADKHEVPFQVAFPYFDCAHWNSFNEAKANGKDFFANHLSFEEKNKFYKDLFEYIPDVPEETKKYYFNCPGLAISTVLLENVGLYIENFSGIPYSDDENKILMRFGKVFQQTYTRFLDLQKAEAQTREAQIESSLEKVRTVALSLKKSDEMLDIAEVLYKQLLELGFTNIRNAIIDIHNEGTETFLDYDYSPDMGKTVTLMSYYDHPIIEKQVRQIKSSSDAFFEIILEGQALQDLIEIRLINGEDEDPRLRQIDQLTYNLYSFGNGAIGISNFGLLSEEHKIVLKRFRNVFAFAYKRYSDLVRAENQAREAQIELALERIRAKTMAMQKSEELTDISFELVKQVQSLGVAVWHCAFNIYDKDQNSSTEWGSNASGTFPKYKTPREGIFLRYYEIGQKGENLHIEEIGEDKCAAHYDWLCTLPGVGVQLIKLRDSGVSFPTSQIDHVAYFKYGYLIFITYKSAPGAHDIFKRFANVFEQTYTRFLDLQKAEEQNKIIQAENDRKTQELEEARQLQFAMLPNQLPNIENLEIAVYMKTATEVGGDYYDFNVGDDDTLTAVIGDATGHGMMSGMMVSIMKSFFISNRSNLELKQFFENSNNSIKNMNLGRLMMASMGVQITSEKVIATNAGMPSLLYFRNKSKKAGEFVSNNMPLGGMKGVKYSLKQIKHEKGDTLLLMSDGFAELKNENDEQYGYSRIKKEFMSVALKRPDEIIEHLKDSAANWINGIEPDDDVTFVVIKIK